MIAKYTRLTIAIAIFFSIFNYSIGQISILFVDDSKDEFFNSQTFANAFDSLGLTYTYFDVENNGVPTLEELVQYNLIVWHTSTSLSDLGFWYGNEIDNEVLKEYLQLESAKLWLVGNDFLYDRYGDAPDNFEVGSFVRDYLGITKYTSQSFVDDGGKGVPYISTTINSPIPNLPNIDWQFSTLYYVDGLEIDQNAVPVYIMDGVNYPLANEICALYYDIPNGGRVLTFAFDLALAKNQELIEETTGTVVDWWTNIINETIEPNTTLNSITIHPTLVEQEIQFQIPDVLLGKKIGLEIVDPLGKKVQSDAISTSQNNYSLILDANLPSGIYYVRIANVENISQKVFTIIKK